MERAAYDEFDPLRLARDMIRLLGESIADGDACFGRNQKFRKHDDASSSFNCPFEMRDCLRRDGRLVGKSRRGPTDRLLGTVNSCIKFWARVEFSDVNQQLFATLEPAG